jgi:hypothetical protein
MLLNGEAATNTNTNAISTPDALHVQQMATSTLDAQQMQQMTNATPNAPSSAGNGNELWNANMEGHGTPPRGRALLLKAPRNEPARLVVWVATPTCSTRQTHLRRTGEPCSHRRGSAHLGQIQMSQRKTPPRAPAHTAAGLSTSPSLVDEVHLDVFRAPPMRITLATKQLPGVTSPQRALAAALPASLGELWKPQLKQGRKRRDLKAAPQPPGAPSSRQATRLGVRSTNSTSNTSSTSSTRSANSSAGVINTSGTTITTSATSSSTTNNNTPNTPDAPKVQQNTNLPSDALKVQQKYEFDA